MKFRITMKMRPFKAETRKEIDNRIREILGGKFDDGNCKFNEADFYDVTLYRKIGTVEILDNLKPMTKTIYGDSDPATIQALHELAAEYGIRIAK